MRNKSKWHLTLPIGLVILLASLLVACGQAIPNIDVSPWSLSFSAQEGEAEPASQTLIIWNSGKGTLNWVISDDAEWLTLSPRSGASTGESDSVTVSADIYGMDTGNYATTITVSASGASSSPLTIPAELNITPAPASSVGHYANSEYGYSFDYPSAWFLHELPDKPGACLLLSPSPGPSQSIAMFLVEVKDAPVEANVEIWTDFRSEEKDFTVLSNTVLIGKWDWLLEYTYTTEDREKRHCWAYFKGAADFQLIADACIEGYEANFIPDELQMILDSFKFEH